MSIGPEEKKGQESYSPDWPELRGKSPLFGNCAYQGLGRKAPLPVYVPETVRWQGVHQ